MWSKYIADYSKSLHCFWWRILVSAFRSSLSSISPSFIIPAPPPHPPPPPLLFVHTDSSAYISKVMWNVTNDPPAASPLKSILCQKDKMSRGRIFSAAAWPRRAFVLLRLMMTCVREGEKNKKQIILPEWISLCVECEEELQIGQICCSSLLIRVLGGFYWGSHVDCVCPCVPQGQVDLGLNLSHLREHTHTRFNPPLPPPYHLPAEQPRQH